MQNTEYFKLGALSWRLALAVCGDLLVCTNAFVFACLSLCGILTEPNSLLLLRFFLVRPPNRRDGKWWNSSAGHWFSYSPKHQARAPGRCNNCAASASPTVHSCPRHLSSNPEQHDNSHPYGAAAPFVSYHPSCTYTNPCWWSVSKKEATKTAAVSNSHAQSETSFIPVPYPVSCENRYMIMYFMHEWAM